MGSIQKAFKKDIIIIEVFSATKYTGKGLVYLFVGTQKEERNRFYIKMGNSKKQCRKYKAGDRYCLLCMLEKVAIASYNKYNELLDRRSEISNAYRQNEYLLLGK